MPRHQHRHTIVQKVMRVPVGRLAPSPTGRLHLGHARSFLVAWWQARRAGGRIVMRVEDLDAPRVAPQHIDDALRDLQWLGLDWDGPVLLQSSGIARILDAAKRLLELGLAFPCVCSRADLMTAQGAPHHGVTEMRYPGTCRGRYGSLAEAEARTGKPAGLRFLAPDEVIVFQDQLAGRVEFDISQTVGDFLILRKGGAPAYQLAVVVDDAAQGVTQVVRGDDLLSSTARQLCLQRALGLPSPSWFHLPLVCDASGRRLAKRVGDLSLHELRNRDVDPRRIVGWVAETCAIKTAPRVTASDVVADFEITRIPKDPIYLDSRALAALWC